MTDKTIYGHEIGELQTGRGSYVFVSLGVRDYFIHFSEASQIRDGKMATPTRAYRVTKMNTDEGEFSTVKIEDNETLEEIAASIREVYSPRIE